MVHAQKEMGQAVRDEVRGVARGQVTRHQPAWGTWVSPQGRGHIEGNGDHGP